MYMHIPMYPRGLVLSFLVHWYVLVMNALVLYDGAV